MCDSLRALMEKIDPYFSWDVILHTLERFPLTFEHPCMRDTSSPSVREVHKASPRIAPAGERSLHLWANLPLRVVVLGERNKGSCLASAVRSLKYETHQNEVLLDRASDMCTEYRWFHAIKGHYSISAGE